MVSEVEDDPPDPELVKLFSDQLEKMSRDIFSIGFDAGAVFGYKISILLASLAFLLGMLIRWL